MEKVPETLPHLMLAVDKAEAGVRFRGELERARCPEPSAGGHGRDATGSPVDGLRNSNLVSGLVAPNAKLQGAVFVAPVCVSLKIEIQGSVVFFLA